MPTATARSPRPTACSCCASPRASTRRARPRSVTRRRRRAGDRHRRRRHPAARGRTRSRRRVRLRYDHGSPPGTAGGRRERASSASRTTARGRPSSSGGSVPARHGALRSDRRATIPSDGWVFVADGALGLDLTLTFPAAPDVDLDLLIDDRRGDSATCERTTPAGSTAGSASRATSRRHSTSSWSRHPVRSRRRTCCDVTAFAIHAPLGVTPGAGAGPALEIEPAVYRGETAPIVAGELVMRERGRGERAPSPPRGAPSADSAAPSRASRPRGSRPTGRRC